MTLEKTTEIIGLFALAYPYAEIFKAENAEDLKKKQTALISIWASALPDVEDWVAQMTAQRCLRQCKFLPTVAEFREAAEEIGQKFTTEADEAYLQARSALQCWPEETAKKMMGIRAWTTIQAMGGIPAFAKGESFDKYGFVQTYLGLLQHRALEGHKRKEIAGK